MFDRPTLLEEPFAQTLSGKKVLGRILCNFLWWEVLCAKSCSTKQWWQMLCASCVVEVVLGSAFGQSLVKVVLGSTLCASFVVQSRTEEYFVQALWYKVVLGNIL